MTTNDFQKTLRPGWPAMSEIGKKIPCRPYLMEAILVMWNNIVRFEMFDEVGVKQIFEHFSKSWNDTNRVIVGGVGAVTFLKNRVKKVHASKEKDKCRNYEWAKKAIKDRGQVIIKLPQKPGRNAIRAWGLVCLQGTKYPANFTGRARPIDFSICLGAEIMMEGIGLLRGKVEGLGSWNCWEKISRKERTERFSFISRRITIRANKWSEDGVTEVIEDFLGKS